MKFSSIIPENYNTVLGEFWKNFVSSFSEKLGDFISKTIAFIALAAVLAEMRLHLSDKLSIWITPMRSSFLQNA